MDVSSMLVTAPSTRRTATVTTSASDAAIESAMSCAVLYLPVPRNRRELNVLPAITSWSLLGGATVSGLRRVAVVERAAAAVSVLRARSHRAIGALFA